MSALGLLRTEQVAVA